jgi:hypothetical protein
MAEIFGVSYERVTSSTASGLRSELADVYRSASSAPPYGETEEAPERFRDRQLQEHIAREAFCGVVARIECDLVGLATAISVGGVSGGPTISPPAFPSR